MSEVESKRRLSSIEKRGWIIVPASMHPDLPKEVSEAFFTSKYYIPKNERERVALWQKIERQVFCYCRHLSVQYSVEFDDLLQEGYIFYEKLLQRYEPLYYRDLRPSDLDEDPKKLSRMYTWDETGKGWAWKFYRIEPYLCVNVHRQLLNHAKKVNKKQNRMFGSENWLSDDGEFTDSVMDSILYHLSDYGGANGINQDFQKVERKLLMDLVRSALDDLIDQYKDTRKQIADLYFRRNMTEQEVYTEAGKSPSTVTAHISAIKKDLRAHPRIQTLFSDLKESEVSFHDIF